MMRPARRKDQALGEETLTLGEPLRMMVKAGCGAWAPCT